MTNQAPPHQRVPLDPVAQVRNLSVWLPRRGSWRQVLDGVDLEVGRGEVLALVGASGAGKTMLARAIAGLLPTRSAGRVTGSVRVDGIEVIGAGPGDLRRLWRRSVGFAFQDPLTALNPTMRVGRQIDEVTGNRVTTARVMERAGITDPDRIRRAYPHQLSGGQRQRVMVAIAIGGQPSLLIADEPSSALDTLTQQRLLATVRHMRRRSTGVLFITHDLDVAASIADRIAVLHEGRVEEVAATGDLLAAPRTPAARRQVDARQALLRAPRRSGTDPSSGPRDGSANEPAVIEVVRVSRSYGRGRSARRALDGVGLQVCRGQTLAVVGESGAGKTTLLRVLAGLDRPDPDGGTVRRLPDIRPQLIFQDAAASMTPWLTVAETLAEPLRAAGVVKTRWRPLVDAALDRVALDRSLACARTRDLSGGQQQRVVIARATMVPTGLLLCDEPTSSTDPATAAELHAVLGRLRDELRLGLVIVTHDIAVARLIADRVLVMRAGRIVDRVDGDLLASTHHYTRRLIDAVPGAGVALRPGAVAGADDQSGVRSAIALDNPPPGRAR